MVKEYEVWIMVMFGKRQVFGNHVWILRSDKPIAISVMVNWVNDIIRESLMLALQGKLK